MRKNFGALSDVYPMPVFIVAAYDEEGNPKFEANTTKDDVTEFLESYNYNIYDSIINMADLMATSYAILSPYDRVSDIATRSTPDPKNRNYFKAEFSNLMFYFLEQSGEIEPNSIGTLKATKNISDEQLDKIFYDVSSLFTYYFNNISSTKIKEPQHIKAKENSN